MTRAASRFASVLLAGLFLSTTASARPFVVQTPRGKKGTAQLIIAPRPARVSTLIIRFEVGAFEDGIRSGITRLAQRAMIDCNKREPEGRLRRDLYAAAAQLEIVTGVREATFVLRAPRAAFAGLAERVLLMTLDPQLDARAFPQCRQRVLRDELPATSTQALAARVAGELFQAPKGSPAGADFRNAPYGDAEVLRELRPKAVERHIGAWLTPANATIIATGAVDAGRLKKVIAKHRGGRRNNLTVLEPSGDLPTTLRTWAPRETAFHLQLIDPKSPAHVAAARVLRAIIEERLRDRLGGPVAADAEVYAWSRPWASAVIVELPGGDGVEEIQGIVADLAAARFSDGELKRNVAFVKGAMLREDARPKALAAALAAGAADTPWHSRAVSDALDGLTQARFVELAGDWLQPDHAISVRLGPEFERKEATR